MWVVAATTTLITSMWLIYLFYAKQYKSIIMFARTFLRDVKTFYILFLVQFKIWRTRRSNGTVVGEFNALAKKHPSKVAFVFENSSWTFGQAENFINKVTNYFEKQGFQKRDSIGLLLENRPEYPCIWLALSKIGVVTTLINEKFIKHAIEVTNCKALIFGSNHADSVSLILKHLKNVKLYQFREAIADTRKTLPNAVDLKLQLLNVSNHSTFKTRQSTDDALLHLFRTDIESGSPRIWCITNIRFMYMCYHSQIYGNVSVNDILYVPLPLFNSIGGVIGIGQTLLSGTATVIRKQFLAEKFWKDCEKYRCTIALYTENMCQGVLDAPYSEYLTHRVKTLLGVGMEVEIWKKFVNKFNVKNVCELFGGSEETVLLGNLNNMVGASGSIPLFMRSHFPIALVSYNTTTKQLIRNKNGFCVRSKPMEIGLMIAKENRIFLSTAEPVKENKIIRDVFANGDMYIRMNIFAEYDELGYFYYKTKSNHLF